MKFPILLIVLSLLSLGAYSQDIKTINKALVTGLSCCERADMLHKEAAYHDSIEQVQQVQIANLEESLVLAKGNTELEEMRTASLQQQLTTTGGELAREHRRKRTWRTLFFITTGLTAGYVGYNQIK